jgi:cytochrome o ubiquinol oxidase operon protein cyoD
MDAVGLTIREGIARYVIGFVLACALTAASFYVLNTSLIWGPGIPVALVMLAVAQISVHLYFLSAHHRRRAVATGNRRP